MTEKTPKPKRKRRRWIVAGALLLMASVAGWWFYPRGDARFVGKWSGRMGDTTSPIIEHTFLANGEGTFTVRFPTSATASVTRPLRWWATSDHVVIRTRQNGLTGQIEDMAGVFVSAFRQTPNPCVESMSVEVTRNEKQLRYGGTPGVVLRRLDE